MKLEIELVPEPLWGVSAYRQLGRGAKWRAIRRDVLRAAGECCSVCGASASRLTCHEQWHYDDPKGVATLTSFTIHCDPCDAATHLGRSNQLGHGQVAIEQFCRVNGCMPADAHKNLADAMAIWRKRNSIAWAIVVAEPLLAKYPALSVLQRGK